MTPREFVDTYSYDHEIPLLVLDGHDDAILGIAERIGHAECVAYSYDKILARLVHDGMDPEEADEFISFNIAGAYVGERTPILIYGPGITQ